MSTRITCSTCGWMYVEGQPHSFCIPKLREEEASIIRQKHAADQLQAMIGAIVNALDDCESILSAGFHEPGTNERSWVIPKSRHEALDVRTVLANANTALKLAGRR